MNKKKILTSVMVLSAVFATLQVLADHHSGKGQGHHYGHEKQAEKHMSSEEMKKMHKNMDDMPHAHQRMHEGEMPHMREVMAQGQINKVMAKHHRLNIDHAPIPEMKWPRMHMNFNVKEGLDLSALKPGQKINFKLLVDGDNNYVIEEIEVIE